ncbi:glucose-6-phosphate dehydrogenase [Gallaecimonas xiamenensis]|uniref:Glucose-6-phosphate 1-dehydrogenase n=1 Tax=Gallaecimonas xiamenensis 3-C-1 TaxID=745411 RepID=K2KH84_9GAMM|nr:glucose-6-phosphate dehydrogenase [Gallaecimonas xiamenensis]EKE76625.1 glucose-6-phosphate 1-dehydrogenase [Gallaecimonas xiamenensis 3-C-1]
MKAIGPCDLVLFGVKGDLARRKLLPALYQLDKAGLLDKDSRIIGVARGDAEPIEDTLDTFLKEPVDKAVLARFKARLAHVSLDFSDMNAYAAIGEVVNHDTPEVYYFATPPSLYGDICQGLSGASLIRDNSRVIMEKPIGQDLASSRVINDKVDAHFNERQIYRIDHYLGKETVQNLLALRFANALFAGNWDYSCIDHVQITVAEEVGIEGRWSYFDKAGQMRDMVQNHLLQVLTLIAMEPPVSLDADAIRDEKLKVLRALRPITSANVNDVTVRGQYSSGFLRGKAVPGYAEEEGAITNSHTETFVALRVDIDNWRWSGVPFYLRTGKRMPAKCTEVVVSFKALPHNIFAKSQKQLAANKLIIRLQPQEGVELLMLNKVPGLESNMRLQSTKLDLSFFETFKEERIADAYERLLLEAMVGNQALFVRRDEIEAAWTWVDSIMEAWDQSGDGPKSYQAGSWGPVASIALITRDGRSWEE